jgi:hypothetical protein
MAETDDEPQPEPKSYGLSRRAQPLPEDGRRGQWYSWQLEQMDKKFCRAMAAENNKQNKYKQQK